MTSKPRSQFTARIAGAIGMVTGAGITLASLFADALGISGGGVGLGWKQLIGAIAGGVIALLGAGVFFRNGQSNT